MTCAIWCRTRELKNYLRMRLLIERWIDLATQLSTLRLTQKAGSRAERT